MQEENLVHFKQWFDDYVTGFYTDDVRVNANLKLKEDHTRRTCEEMNYLTEALGLDDNGKRIAETVALFHDIARFEQFARYHTYNDWESIDHCKYALVILRDKKLLDRIPSAEKGWIEKAIEYHGLRELPAGLDEQTLLFSKLIRDADKLDIFFWVVRDYAEYKKDPDNFLLQLEFPDEPYCSPAVIEQILKGERVDYSLLRTMNDMRLLQLGWVYDINFTASLKRLKQRRLLEKMAELLPGTREIEQVKKKVFDFVECAIEKNQAEVGN